MYRNDHRILPLENFVVDVRDTYLLTIHVYGVEKMSTKLLLNEMTIAITFLSCYVCVMCVRMAYNNNNNNRNSNK